MKHFASPQSWELYSCLPTELQELADKNHELLKQNPQHPSLHFRRVSRFWSARVGIRYRALAIELPQGMLWFWIGTHTEYDKLLQGS